MDNVHLLVVCYELSLGLLAEHVSWGGRPRCNVGAVAPVFVLAVHATVKVVPSGVVAAPSDLAGGHLSGGVATASTLVLTTSFVLAEG